LLKNAVNFSDVQYGNTKWNAGSFKSIDSGSVVFDLNLRMIKNQLSFKTKGGDFSPPFVLAPGPEITAHGRGCFPLACLTPFL